MKVVDLALHRTSQPSRLHAAQRGEVMCDHGNDCV